MNTAAGGRGAAGGGSAGGALSHLGDEGEARMVDISPKAPTLRSARAEAIVRMDAGTRRAIEAGAGPKGSVLGVARIAGITGAKRTAELIPLCHPLAVVEVRIDFSWLEGAEAPPPSQACLRIEAVAKVTAKTGVEMEALTAASVAALAVYDMTKAIDRGLVIERIRLLEKLGGKSGGEGRGATSGSRD